MEFLADFFRERKIPERENKKLKSWNNSKIHDPSHFTNVFIFNNWAPAVLVQILCNINLNDN